jgi:hypothetical protein
MARKQSPQQEFTFTLPQGLVDEKGRLNRNGIMRLATARDEIEIHQDQQVKANPAYDVLIRLARVIRRLGSLSSISPQQLEDLTILDLAYLREFYNRINQHQDPTIGVACPHCQMQFRVELNLAGESEATP